MERLEGPARNGAGGGPLPVRKGGPRRFVQQDPPLSHAASETAVDSVNELFACQVGITPSAGQSAEPP